MSNANGMGKYRTRISIAKENRIWDLRCQGYNYEQIACIVNIGKSSSNAVLRRVRRRPPVSVDPIRRGRIRGFLNDCQIHEIRLRRLRGETCWNIAKDFNLHQSTISRIALYPELCMDDTYPGYAFDFSNRLVSF